VQYAYTALCMTMILDSEKLNPQYNENSVLTMPWIAGGGGGVPGPHGPPLATGLLTLTPTLELEFGELEGHLLENILWPNLAQPPLSCPSTPLMS